MSYQKKNFSIITEETGSILTENKNNFWIIDPIDGTTNFLHGIPHFCISLAYASNEEIISGVIFDPIKNEMYYGEKNSGAYFQNQRIRVSKKKKLEECLFGSNLESLMDNDLNMRISGSAALDLAYVSSGRLDGFFQKNLNIWDIAAGFIILKEAGGQISPIEVNKIKNHSIIASSEVIFTELNEKLVNF